MFPRRLADLPLHRRRSLFDSGRARPLRGTASAGPERLGYALLALRQGRRLGERAVERVERLLAPRARERVAPRAQRGGQLRELLLRLRAGPLRRARIPLLGRLGGALHGAGGLLRGALRRRERGFATRWLPEVFPHLLDAARQRIGALRERALAGRRRAVRPAGVGAVPLALAALQVFRVGGQGGKRALPRGPLEQLPAPLELRLEPLLRLGAPLQRLPGG